VQHQQAQGALNLEWFHWHFCEFQRDNEFGAVRVRAMIDEVWDFVSYILLMPHDIDMMAPPCGPKSKDERKSREGGVGTEWTIVRSILDFSPHKISITGGISTLE
jgi:hypothetical protein